jgi:FKBP-type peptidyl-prolyl cis-trans isomerase
MVGAAVGMALVSLAGCVQAPASPTKTPAFTRVDLVVGTGAEAVVGSVVEVNYTGWLYDPTRPDFKGGVFDTSIGRATFTFTLGVGSVIQGWDEGLVGMKVGGTRRLIVPPAYAYGGVRTSSIPAEAALLFDVVLVSIAEEEDQ